MKFFNTKIADSFVSLLLVLAILGPSVLKISHAIFEHEDTHCVESGSLHVHGVELDCDFQKFKLSHQQYPVFCQIINFISFPPRDIVFSCYTYISNYQELHFTLRGPPLLSFLITIYTTSINF